jgi:hypothetical protein
MRTLSGSISAYLCVDVLSQNNHTCMYLHEGLPLAKEITCMYM